MNVKRALKAMVVAGLAVVLGVAGACGGDDATSTPLSAATTDVTVAVPTETPPPSGKMEPSGVLDVGMNFVPAASHVLHLQGYTQMKYDTLVTHETWFRTAPDGTPCQ